MRSALFAAWFAAPACVSAETPGTLLEAARKAQTGRTPDWSEGFLLLERAAEQGHAEASYRLGQALLRGEGAPLDIDAAFLHLRTAAAKGWELGEIPPPPQSRFANWIEADAKVRAARKGDGMAREELLRDLQVHFFRAREAAAHLGPADAGRTALLIAQLATGTPARLDQARRTLLLASEFLQQHSTLEDGRGGFVAPGRAEMNAAQYHARKDATESLLLLRQVRLELARVLEATGNENEAVALLETLLADREQPELLSSLARLYEKVGPPEKAREYAERDAHRRREISERMFLSARELEAAGDLDSAMEYRRRAADLQSGKPYGDLDLN